MTVSVIFTALVVLLLAVGGPVSELAQAKLGSRLQIAAVVRFPDGHEVWTARDWPQDGLTAFSGELYTAETLCTFQSNLSDPTRPRSYGWAFKTTAWMTEVGSNQLTVRLDWRQSAPVPSGDAWKSRTLNVDVGQTVTVDRLVPGPVPEGQVLRCHKHGASGAHMWRSERSLRLIPVADVVSPGTPLGLDGIDGSSSVPARRVLNPICQW